VGIEGFSRWQIGRDVKMTSRVHLVPRLRMRGAIPLLPTRLHSVVLY
jgi:hypothetical protein